MFLCGYGAVFKAASYYCNKVFETQAWFKSGHHIVGIVKVKVKVPVYLLIFMNSDPGCRFAKGLGAPF